MLIVGIKPRDQDEEALIATARMTLAAFASDFEAGTLDPRRHRALGLLSVALEPYSEPGAKPSLGAQPSAAARTPGLAHPDRAAADLSGTGL